ncbi:MAG: glycyl-radical enzyme activating protein, partial [Clostridia bacterium]|nr:glycyl-radical enzyme activating protein [Clostridia bacterium]
MATETGRIFSIEEFSTFDGPGIRMTVFLKGCPLRCPWCHNPEGQRFEVEYMRNVNGCTGCGACERVGERTGDVLRLTERSAAACPRNLVRRSGEDISVDALAEKILKNAEILRATGGGVTFSGGEPLCQTDFVMACAQRLDGLSVALQTTGYAPSATFERALSVCDYVLYDLKLMDPAAHKAVCGVD